MRFILTDSGPLSITDLEAALVKIDDKYSLERDEEEAASAHLYYGDGVYGEIEINHLGNCVFDEEVEELIDFAENSQGEGKARVLDILKSTECLCCVRVLNGGRETEDTLSRIDPIWNWFFKNRAGLMQADGEGYYDSTELILEVR